MLRYFFIVFLLMLSQFASAATVGSKVTQFKNWTVYKVGEGKDKICYIGTFPLNASGVMNQDSTATYVLVAAFKKGDEFSASVAGKITKPGGISVRVDKGNQISLYTEGNMGWAMDRGADDLLISIMRKGNILYVMHGGEKSEVVDRYSLSGFTAAYEHIKSSCN